MSPAERIRVLAFLAAVAAVYIAAAGVIAAGLWRKLKGESACTKPAWRKWAARVVLALAVLGLGCAAYGYSVEPYWLDVTRVAIETDKLPAGSQPIRLVHISDLQCDPKVRLEDELPARVAELAPDLIVFTGDAINSRAGLDNFRRCMTELAKIAPTYIVEGNWDHYFGQVDLVGKTGAKLLDDEAITLDLAGRELCLVGVSTRGVGKLSQTLADTPAGVFTVLLHHYPDGIEHFAAAGVDLVCCGHTHGGQIALPFYGALMTLSKYGKRFEAGLYRVVDTWMYVSRGIGMEGGRAPRVRFFARPEVTLIEIRPAGGIISGPKQTRP